MTPARHAVPLAFVLAILLALPSLNAPLLQDDVIHRGMLLDKAKGVQWSPLELYDFVGGPTRRASLMRDRGLLPWFTDDELTLRFFRPLSSAALAFDARLFGERTWLSRLHSLSWFLAILGLAAALHRRFLPPATAGVATLIYALAAGHALPVSFIAARHALVCTAFSLLAFWCHVRGRDDGWRPGRWLAPAAVAVGLFGGEMALGAVALIGAWELFGRRDRLPARLLAVIPFAVLAVVYLGGYVAMDYGARGSGAYTGPSGGLANAATVARHFLILVGELVAAMPADAFGLAPAAVQTAAALWAVTTTVAFLWLYRFARPFFGTEEAMVLRWMPIAAAAAALPGALALVGGRVLTLALVPSSAVVAVVLVGGVAAARAVVFAHSLAPSWQWCSRGSCSGTSSPGPRRARSSASSSRGSHASNTRWRTDGPCPGVMVLVAAADPTIATYVPATLALHDRGPERLGYSAWRRATIASTT